MTLLITSSLSQASTCYGTVANGRLGDAVELPAQGPNFRAYSSVARLLGRTWAHEAVRDVVVDAYRLLEVRTPGITYVYGETGLRNGGRFKPHRTHQNGLSVDLMVPVRDERGRSVHLPTGAHLKFGYAIEFDKAGRYENLHIDFDALAALITALRDSAQKHNVGIDKVIFDPHLSGHLFKTRQGATLKHQIPFMRKPARVRHDEHIHVDFKLACKPLADQAKR